jgi:hypothetical protein
VLRCLTVLDPPTGLLVRRQRARARFEERRAVLHCDCDEEARPRSGYRPGAPGGCPVEHVDEHFRAAAWMGASPLPPAWCRVTNLHVGRDHHSRDRGCRDRAHRITSQPRLTPGPPYIHGPRRTRGPPDRLGTLGSPYSVAVRAGRTPARFRYRDAQPLDPPRNIRLRRCELGNARCLFRSVAYLPCGSGSSSSETELMQ